MNIPQIKLGIVAVSRDCFPMSLSEKRRIAVCKAYTEKYGEIYECPTVVENELHMVKATDIGLSDAPTTARYPLPSCPVWLLRISFLLAIISSTMTESPFFA